MASLGNIYLKFTADTGDLVRGLNSIDGQLKGFASSIRGITGLLGGAFAISSLAEFGKESIKMSSQIESAFLKIENLTDTSAGDLDFFKKSLAGVSSQVGRSQKELAEGLYGITSSGLVGKEALEALEIASKASAIGLGDVNTIARSLTGVLNAYGKENISAARAAEILFQTLKLGSLEAEALAPALSKVLPISSALGISFEQVGAFIAQASLAGTEASEAVTQLTSIIGALVNPTSEAEEELAKYGLSMEQIRDMAKKDLSEALIFLTEKLGGNETALSKVIGRKEGIVGLYSVAADKADDYRAKVVGVTAATNDFGKAFNDVGQTSAQKWAVFTAQIDNVKAAIGEALIELINEFLPKATGGVDNLSEAMDKLPGLAKQFVLDLKPIVEVFGYIDDLIKTINKYEDFIGTKKTARGLIGVYKSIKDISGESKIIAKTLDKAFDPKKFTFTGLPKPPAPTTDKKKPTPPAPPGPDKDQISILDQLNKKRQALVTTLENFIAAGRGTAKLEADITSLDKRILDITKTRDEALKAGIPKIQELRDAQSLLQDQLLQAISTGQEYTKIESDLLEVSKQLAQAEGEYGSTMANVADAVNAAAVAEANLKKVRATTLATGSTVKEPYSKGERSLKIPEVTIPNALGAKVDSIGASFQKMGETATISMNGINQSFIETSGLLDGFNDQLNSIIDQGIQDSAIALAEQLASAFSGDGFNINAVLIPLADMLIDVGKLAIATGIAIKGIKVALEKLGPVGAIAAGVALVTLGTIVKGKLSRAAPRLAKGALSYGEHTATIGDNPNARFDPEVTAPSTKLKKLFEDITIPLIKELNSKEKKQPLTNDLPKLLKEFSKGILSKDKGEVTTDITTEPTEPPKKIFQVPIPDFFKEFSKVFSSKESSDVSDDNTETDKPFQVNIPNFIKDFIPSILSSSTSLQGTAYVTVEGEFKFRNNELVAAVKSGQAVHLRNHGS